ncbi:uncharacterized protein LOC133791697 [Humulus lupulus]|uniref:uncharacterized protein LOC133791697 n=1 Tax=Humulus lupulus TaxID=3486 RepID=UPI002B40900A|nr:uncharacterized protein LOC133791697 [Humulus lupulus]
MASARKRSNQIQQLQDEDADATSWSSVVSGIRCSVNNFHNEELLKPILEDEVKVALFQMHPDKAPGPDGMGPGFFQHHWGIVGTDIVNMVKDFFVSGTLPTGLNDTNLVLIPKKKNFSTMSDLRPIALCNVLYKVISKVLANRMRGLIDQIISDTQSAFIPGRLISDNVMVAFEVMHYLKRKRKGKKGFMALKLDMSKAYDRVEWGYLRAVMVRMGFHEKWIDLVMTCVTSVRYKIIHGGHVMGPICPSRGIRQGDPLSTYLFIICAEGLSSLIQKFEATRVLQGCRVAQHAPSITHMFFADDSYLFCQATRGAAESVLTLLHLFETASGQKVNTSKSSIFFSPNTDTSSRTQICSILGMTEATEGSLYLGLPNIIGRNKNAILGFIKNKVISRIKGWEGKFLSRAGKEILLKTVIQSLPTYAMSVFLLPIGTCNDIEKLMASFWWKTNSSKGRGIIWMSWDRLAAPKDEGGMGFRHLHDFNLAMLAKQGWRLLCKPDSLVGRVFKARYFPNSDFLSADLGQNPSFVWRSIWGAQDLVRLGVVRTIGNGDNTSITGHPWLPDSDNRFASSTHPGIPLSDNADSDFWSWSGDRSGLFIVRSAYTLLQLQKPNQPGFNNSGFWRKLWHLKIPPKVTNFLWRAVAECLPTCFHLVTKKVQISAMCPVCNNHVETTTHALLTCDFASSCWSSFEAYSSMATLSSFGNWFEYMQQTFDAEEAQDKTTLLSLSLENNDARSESWIKPGTNQIKINVDAALFQRECSYGFGLVARDSSGRLIEAKTCYQGGVFPAEVVEAMGIKEALSWIKSKNWHNVEIETDSMLSVQSIRSNQIMSSIFGLLIQDCQILLSSLHNVHLRFIKRSANRVAHAVARHSRFLSGCSIFEHNVWADLQALLYSEC